MLRSPILCLNLALSGLCFNLDVNHPIIIENPNPSQEKSYFGYSVVLFSEGERGDKWIKVGAPKSTYYDREKKIQHSGIIYHCPYMENCRIEENLKYSSIRNFDEKGNLTNAWTGGSMDINYKYKSLAISASNWQYFHFLNGEYSPKVRGGIFLKNFKEETIHGISPLKQTLEEARMKEMKLVEYENTSDEETFRKRKFPLKYQEYCSFIPPPTLTQPNEETSLSSNSSSKESLKESNADGSCCKSPTTDKPEKMESVLSGNKNLVELPTCGEKTTSNQVNVYDSHRPKDNISIDITGINVEAAAYAQLQGMLTHISGQLAECLVWHKSHSDRLDKIENKYQNKALHTTQNELYGMFPIDSKVKLDKLEEKLVDAEFKRVNWLGMIGGKDYRSCAFATLQKVFSISFAPTLSWAGRNNNLAVKELAIISSIHDPGAVNSLSYYSRAQTGFSLHFLQDENEILLGAPGVHNYLGTVLKIKNIDKKKTDWKYEIMAPRGNYYEYLGYALTSGCFYKKHELYYVTGLPRGYGKGSPERSKIRGSVLIFSYRKDEIKEPKYQYEINFRAEFHGSQFGEYFGASLAAGDLNGDKLDDLIVGAPFRTNDDNEFNHGSVYVIYGHRRKLEQNDKKNRIDGTVTNGQFGLAVMFLGSLDNDGYGELAVSAPQEDISGVVYIYTYDKLIKNLVVSQKILGKEIFPGLKGFGMTFSRPHDIDDNGFSDIIIGSPISEHAVLLRSKPTVLVRQTILAPKSISKSNKSISFKCCYTYENYPEPSLTIIRNLTVDEEQHPTRFTFDSSEPEKHSEKKVLRLTEKKEFCEDILVYRTPVYNYKDYIIITLTYRIAEYGTTDTKHPIFISSTKPIEKDTFFKKCPILRKKSFKSETKIVMWDDLCKGEPCKSKLITRAKIGSLSKENTFILGSTDLLSLEVTVLNEGDPAYKPSLEMFLPNGVNLRRSEVNCENIDVGHITCDLGEELLNKITYHYELNIDEVPSEKELTFLLNSSTITVNEGNLSSINTILKLEREADFEITGESKESSYICTREETTIIQNIFKIEETGPSPMPEIEVNIMVPYEIMDLTGVYRKFAEIEEYRDKNVENQISKCQNMTDYKSNLPIKGMRREVNFTHPYDDDFLTNKTDSRFDPINIFNMNCTMQNVKCALLKCHVGPFDNTQKYAEVTIEMKVNFQNLEDMLKVKESVLILTEANIFIENFTQSGNRSDFTKVENLLIIEKQFQIPVWILVGSAIGGLIILVILTTCLAKAGFFKRKDQEKLRLLKQEIIEEDRFLEEMIERELASGNENVKVENPFCGIIRKREPTEEADEKNELYGALLTEE